MGGLSLHCHKSSVQIAKARSSTCFSGAAVAVEVATAAAAADFEDSQCTTSSTGYC